MREILFVAGEISGDTHAAAVARELKARKAPFRLVGIGGESMREQQVELLEHVKHMAVMGFVGIVRHIPQHWALLRLLRKRIDSGQIALVIVVDYPGFNMKVAAAATRAGVPVLYYITPQVWAWGKGRLPEIARTVTKAAVILPFEEALLREHGIDATFVGHPLLDRAASLPSRDRARAELGLDTARPVLALFPGSRAQEIRRHLELFVETARLIERRIPGLQVIVSGAPHTPIDPALCPYPVVRSASFAVLRAADAAMCKSGTTTLEAAVAGCPLVLAFRTSAIEYALARRAVTIPHIGLVNIVAGRGIVPEFVQHDLQPPRVADTLARLLAPDSTERAEMVRNLDEVRRALGTPGAAGRVAEMALGLVSSRAERGISDG